MNSDFRDLLKLFNAHRVRYLVVGGYAVMKYTEPRYTKDLDIWVEASPKNARAVFRALRRFEAPLANLTEADFAKEGFFYQMGRPPARVDILMSIKGIRVVAIGRANQLHRLVQFPEGKMTCAGTTDNLDLQAGCTKGSDADDRVLKLRIRSSR
jgi:hypothetical protein